MAQKAAKEDVKRTTISPGIFMDKFREKTNGINYYVIKVELKLFQVLEITIDFTNSKNIKIEGSPGDSLQSTAFVQPFEYKEVARLVLNQGWSLKTKINFTMTLPGIDVQRKYLQPFQDELAKMVKAFSGSDSMDFANIPESQTNSFLETKQADFVDVSFAPDYNSVGFSEEQCIQKYDSLVHWKRLKDIVYAEDIERQTNFPLQNFETPAHPTDVRAGKLDDLLALSAIAALSEIEGFAERTMELKSPTSRGVIKVKVYQTGLESVMLLDDFIPCFPLGEPMFGANVSRSFWVILLEKALAKKFGSYAQLRQLNFMNCIIDMSGLPAFASPLPGTKVQSEPMVIDAFWNTLTGWLESRYLVAADTQKSAVNDSLKSFNNQTSCVVVKAAQKDDIRLVNLRNQFGVLEWDGDWSLQSPLWTEEMVRHFLPDMTGEDDTVWMSLADFLKHFENITVVKSRKWKRSALKGQFITAIDDENPSANHVSSRYCYEFEVSSQSKVIFGVHQEDNQVPGVKLSRPYLDIGISILKREQNAYKIVTNVASEVTRQVFLEQTLEPGRYILLPTSTGLGFRQKQTERLTLRSYSLQDRALQLIVRSIFDKLDADSDGFISYSEMRRYYSKFGKQLTEEDFKVLLSVYAKKNLDIQNPLGFPEHEFLVHFFDTFETFDQAQSVFTAFGFDKNLFSFRSRVFGLTVHSDIPIELTAKDALSANIDHLNTKLMIKLFGNELTDIQGLSVPSNKGIVPRVYVNE